MNKNRFYRILANNGSPFLPLQGPRRTMMQSKERRPFSENGDKHNRGGGDDSQQRLLETGEGTSSSSMLRGNMTKEEENNSDGDDYSWRCKRRSSTSTLMDRRRRQSWTEPRGRDKMDAISRVVSFILCTLLLIMFFLLFWDPTILDESYAHVSIPSGPYRWMEIERICKQPRNDANRTRMCTTVADIFDMESYMTKRVLFFGTMSEVNHTLYVDFDTTLIDYESEVLLVPPKGASFWDSDTRLWPIDHGHLLNEYVAAMAILPVLLGAIPDQPSATAASGSPSNNVLVIGLGGGTVDMFWHTHFPWLNITVYELEPAVIQLAAKWFESRNDSRRTAMLGDGLKAIEESAQKGTKFDIILVDACDPAGSATSMPCPGAEFLTPKALHDSRLALAPMGAFVLNVLPLAEEEQNVRAVQQKLLASFPTCVRTRMAKQMNNIFTCLPYAIEAENLREMTQLWNERMEVLKQRFGLGKLLANAKLTISQENHTNKSNENNQQ